MDARVMTKHRDRWARDREGWAGDHGRLARRAWLAA